MQGLYGSTPGNVFAVLMSANTFSSFRGRVGNPQ